MNYQIFTKLRRFVAAIKKSPTEHVSTPPKSFRPAVAPSCAGCKHYGTVLSDSDCKLHDFDDYRVGHDYICNSYKERKNAKHRLLQRRN